MKFISEGVFHAGISKNKANAKPTKLSPLRPFEQPLSNNNRNHLNVGEHLAPQRNLTPTGKTMRAFGKEFAVSPRRKIVTREQINFNNTHSNFNSA